ncbi:NAD(P)-binding protein [Diaphorobacter sp. HDW4A]|uniref:FAD-dependent oxidoreductase n=1 Tax=Diaphorobacter sp. HDW4A TaxID=2714924 RepID=UPI00140BDCD6|nr:NAD(P)/FAD-dependent oxidoreductase [Diaphorobacter sp. HDW4A]QIL82756.1 NAD(P)-binding protein [Diaphorobacter sp. HDW4A]
MSPFSRREFMLSGAALVGGSLLAGCEARVNELEGGFTGVNIDRGHALRDRLKRGGDALAPSVTHRAGVVIAGGGIAGLSAARALRLAGVDDFVLLELEDRPGGNSKGGSIKGISCPLGAHYLPVPGDDASEVQDFLEELGLRKRVAGRWQYDEMSLCHSPQERLFFNGQWQEGLLPMQEVGAGTLQQYRRFSELVAEQSRAAAFTMPTMKTWMRHGGLPASHAALDAITFDAWLATHGLGDPHLHWYLDYACRDDYGASAARVSAWSGIAYFASRHGFHAPSEEQIGEDERDAVLTWPEGNGWLSQQLAAPLAAKGPLRTGHSVIRIAQTRHAVEVDVHVAETDRIERWVAGQCIVALPVFLAARVIQSAPDFLQQAAKRMQWAPWLVANIHVDAPLDDRAGAAPSWDNVLYADAVPGGLGYVDASHQRLDPRPAPTVLSYYQALGDLPDARKLLAEQPWTYWRDPIIASLSQAHPDLAQRATRMEITRYGHAMSIPVPGDQALLGRIGMAGIQGKRLALSNGERVPLTPTPASGRLSFAHADWSGYSVFEEAFTRGWGAGALTAMQLRGA